MEISLARQNSISPLLFARRCCQPYTRRLLVFALLMVGVCSLSFSTTTVVVGTCLSNVPLYAHIQQAVNAVPPGSTIKVCPGTYKEQVLITESLTLTGIGANGATGSAVVGNNNPVIASPSGGVVANASDLSDGSGIAAQIAVVTPTQSLASPIVVNISNIAIDGSNNMISACSTDLVGIYYQNASGTVNHVATRFQELPSGLGGCQAGLGIFAQSGYGTGGTSTVTIESNSVHDYQKNGITIDGSGTVGTVTGNYVVGQGPTSVIAQNGIQVSDGANGKVTTNTVTDDVYINPSGCSGTTPPSCFSASGILLYDSGTVSLGITVSTNTVSNTQGGIVTFGDSLGTADNNVIFANKVTTSPAAGPFQIDGIDLCSNNNSAKSNIVFNSSGAGIHIDSQCTETSGPSGNNSTVSTNTINEGCAGVLLGNSTGNTISGNATYNVVNALMPGDSCLAGAPAVADTTTKTTRLRPQPRHH